MRRACFNEVGVSRLPMLPEGKGPPPKLWRHLVTHFRRHHQKHLDGAVGSAAQEVSREL